MCLLHDPAWAPVLCHVDSASRTQRLSRCRSPVLRDLHGLVPRGQALAVFSEIKETAFPQDHSICKIQCLQFVVTLCNTAIYKELEIAGVYGNDQRAAHYMQARCRNVPERRDQSAQKTGAQESL